MQELCVVFERFALDHHAGEAEEGDALRFNDRFRSSMRPSLIGSGWRLGCRACFSGKWKGKRGSRRKR